MSKISTYEVVPVPKLADKLIGTSVGGEIEDVTYNFTLQELLDLYIPLMPANNLQGILDFGNTATQDINLFGTITTTYLDVTDTANLYITYLNEETHIVGSVFDSLDLVGTPGQVLTSTGEGVEWYTLPPIFTPNLQQVLTEGNTADIDIILDANLEALDVSSNTASIADNINILGTITDGNSAVGSAGQVLESTVTGVQWVDLPVYSATSPLLFNSATKTFSIQPANSTQGGYLTANDWITFNGKQDAGSYITALTGEATATGPGSVPITLNNASVIAKVLTGLNVAGGSISASDSILTAFGKVQNQINGLVGGVQYQGTWNANTNTPTLTSSVGTQGHFYIVNVAGNTDLNGITDWKVGDWAIFNNSSWTKVDNTESVTSVNGQVGAVSLTTDDIPEGATNLYYLDSRARAALSFAAGSGAYNSLTGVITIPTDNNQILNGAGYITLASLSATAPLTYNNLTGAFGIPKATTLVDGYLSAIDWTTFNNKQNYLGGTGLVKSTAGTITYITDNSGNWNTAYDRSIVSAAVTGTTTKTLTLNEQDGNTITASWTDLDTGLTSVGVSMPSAFSVANSPLTANGTIAITGAGTTLEYIDGTGALRTFPALTGYVPYTGATTNVDLGEYGISAGYFQADLTPTGALQVGRMQWNSVDGTMDLRLMGNNVTLQIGEENVTRVVNKSGVDLLEANYQVVRIRKVAEGGAQGQRLAVVLAQGNNENNSTEVLGIVTETILVNQEGFVTNFGEVKQINTTGSLQGETWVDGDVVYLSATTPGQLTNIRPIAPNHAVIVGYVTYAHANNGKIYVSVDTGYELGELHNVYAPSPANNASIWWNSSTSRYENNTIAGILGYTPANDTLVVHLAGTETITGAKTFTTKVTINTGGTDDQFQIVGTAPSVRLTNAVSGATINGFIAMAGATNNYIQGAVSGDMCIGNQNNGKILFGFGSGTATQKMSLDASGNAIIAGSLTLGTTLSNGTAIYTLPSASGTLALTSDLTGFVTSVTASGPLASSGGTTPNITIQQASGSQDGYLSSTDWTTFNNKQAAGNYITSLTGEATASGPGAASVTLSNAAVTGKVLTGINITGGTVQATDSILTGFGKLQNQINALVGSTIYQGTWNASTNTPALASGVGTKGYYYIVNVAGSTNLDGITDWNIGDWAIFDGTAWQQVDNTDSVSSVNGFTGAVSLTTDNIPEGTTNLYFTNTRARDAITLTTTGSSGAATYSGGVLNIPNYGSALSGYVPYTGATGAVNLGPYDLTVNSVIVGKGAGTGGNNVVLGDNVLSANTTGSRNVAIGTYPLWKNTTGFGNIGIGAEALINQTTANLNIAIGDNTAKYITSGSSNTIIGPSSALSNLTTGSYNTILGGSLDGGVANVSNNIILADGQGNIRYRFDGTNNNFYQNVNFSSTIGNGTYNYTLPGATGTLALTSQIPSVVGVYLPLAGGTMTGPIANNVDGGVIMESNATENNNWLWKENNKLWGTFYFNKASQAGLVVGSYTTIGAETFYMGGNSGIGYAMPSGWTGYQSGSYIAAMISNYTGYIYSGSTVYAATSMLVNNNIVLHAGNYGSYALPLTGGTMTGTPVFASVYTNGTGDWTNTVNPSYKVAPTSGYWRIVYLSNAVATSGVYNYETGKNVYWGEDTDTGIYSFRGRTVSITSNAIRPLLLDGSSNQYIYIKSASGCEAMSQYYNPVAGDWYAGIRVTAGLGTLSSYHIYSGVYGNDVFVLNTNGTAKFASVVTLNNVLDFNGDNGIASLNDKLALGVLGTSYAWIQSFGSRPLAINASGNNVLIGTTTNSVYTLDVNGTGRFSGKLSATKSAKNAYALEIKGGLYGSPRFQLYDLAVDGNAYVGLGVDMSGGAYEFSNYFPRYGSNGRWSVGSWAGDFGTGQYVSGYNEKLYITESLSEFSTVLKVNNFFRNAGNTNLIYWSSASQSAYFGAVLGDVSGGTANRTAFFRGSGLGASVWWGRVDGNGNNVPNAALDSNDGMLGFWVNSGGTGGGTWTKIFRMETVGITMESGSLIGNVSGTLNGYTTIVAYDGNNIAGKILVGGGTRNISTQNPEGYSGEVRLGAAWDRGGIYASGTLSLSTSSSQIDFVFSNSTRAYMRSDTGLVLGGFSGGNYNENIRLVDASNNYSVIAFGATGSSGAGRFNFLKNPSDNLEIRNAASVNIFNITQSGVTTFASSVTASAFFESSDSRLKSIIKDDYKVIGIESVKARLYVKDGKEEIGYYAQDLESILPSSVSKNDAGFLSLSYTQVHTAKIAVIEDEITLLKKRVSELEAQLNLN